MTQVITENCNVQATACMCDLQFEKHFISTVHCTVPTTRHLGASLIFMFYILTVYILWLTCGVICNNDKPFRKYYLHIKTSLSPTRHFLTHYRLLLTFLFYLKCHQHRPQLASRAIKYHFGQNIRPQARNLKKIMDHTFNRAEVYTKVGKLHFFSDWSPPSFYVYNLFSRYNNGLYLYKTKT